MKVIQLINENEIVKEFNTGSEYTDYLRQGLVNENEFVRIVNK